MSQQNTTSNPVAAAYEIGQCEINNADLSYHPTNSGESCFRISMNQRAL